MKQKTQTKEKVQVKAEAQQEEKAHLVGLPTHEGKHMVSVLFMVTAPEVKVQDKHVEITSDSNVVVFSDRPHRIAKPYPGGVNAFAAFFSKSDFTKNPPNVTFAGNLNADGKEYYTIFELGDPILASKSVLFPIIQIIGEEKAIPDGTYSNVSMVVDDIWSAILSGLETAAAAVGTAVACTVGEVASMGADTAVCVAGVVGTAAAATNTGVEASKKD